MTTNRSTRRAARSTRPTRPARASRVLMLSTASAAGAAALIAGGYAQASERGPAPDQPAPVSVSRSADRAAPPAPDRPVRVVHEVGTVLSGTADVAGTPVIVELYENSTYGSSVQVVLGDVESDAIGFLEQQDPFIRDGELDVTVEVKGTPVRLHGTVAPSGRPTRLVDPIQDNGERIVTKGTNTPLATDITVTVEGASAPAEFALAFSFDLETRKVTLYGR